MIKRYTLIILVTLQMNTEFFGQYYYGSPESKQKTQCNNQYQKGWQHCELNVKPVIFEKGCDAGYLYGDEIGRARAIIALWKEFKSHSDKTNILVLAHAVYPHLWQKGGRLKVKRDAFNAGLNDTFEIERAYQKGLEVGRADIQNYPQNYPGSQIHYPKLGIPNLLFAPKSCFEKGKSACETVNGEDWFQEGYKKGVEAGIKDGFFKHYQEIGKEAREMREDQDLVIRLQKSNHGDQTIDTIQLTFNDSYVEGIEKATHDWYVKGVKDGRKERFQTEYLQYVEDKKGQAKFDKRNMVLAIDCQKVSGLFTQLGKSKSSVNANVFAEALDSVNLPVLRYLNSLYAEDLTAQEKKDVFDFYFRINKDLAETYYATYLRLCLQRNFRHQVPYFDYRYYQSAEAFLDVVRTGLCSIAEACYAYAKGNRRPFETIDFYVMGSGCELIIKDVLPQIETCLSKQMLILDYDECIPSLQASTQILLTEETAVIRSETKKISESINASGTCKATVDMDIITICEIGYTIDDLIVSVNHSEQCFFITISATPRLLNIISQDYHVRSLSTKSDGPCTCDDCISCTKTCRCKVSESDLKKLFNDHKPEISELQSLKDPLGAEEADRIIPDLRKILEPAISLPPGLYEVKLEFGGSKQTICASKNF